MTGPDWAAIGTIVMSLICASANIWMIVKRRRG